MQYNYDSATLTGRAIALPAPKPSLSPSRPAHLPNRKRRSTSSLLYEANKDSWEIMAWLALGICSLAVLVISLI